MSRCIDADALMATLSHNCYPVQHDMTSIEPGMTLMGMLQAIQEQPTVEPERKKGKWIDNETSYADGVRQTCTCSICGQRSVRPLGRFCRWCGADMRGENDDIPIEYFESGGK